MKKILLSLFAIAAFTAHAQTSVNQVIILNEGYYNWSSGMQDVPVTIGAYNPATHIYMAFDTITGAQFASDVIINGNFIYAACSNGIRKYDKVTKQLVASNTATAIRKMCVWNNQLLVSRGDYMGITNNFFQAYDLNNLSFIYQLDNVTGPAFSTEGIAVYGDSCYIALNNGFNFPNYVGKVGVVYLPTQTYVREFDLGATGINPDYLTIRNGELITLNNRDFTNASVSTFDINGGTLTTTDLAVSSGCGTSVVASTDLLYQVQGENNLKKFNTSSLTTYDSLQINQAVYGLAHDVVNNKLYAGVTDYFSFGKIFIYSLTGAAVDSFDVSVAPGNIAIDYNGPLAVNELNRSQLEIYPNPATDFIIVKSNNAVDFKIYDVVGNMLIAEKLNSATTKINIGDLKNGVYFIKVDDGKTVTIQKLVKQ